VSKSFTATAADRRRRVAIARLQVANTLLRDVDLYAKIIANTEANLGKGKTALLASKCRRSRAEVVEVAASEEGTVYMSAEQFAAEATFARMRGSLAADRAARRGKNPRVVDLGGLDNSEIPGEVVAKRAGVFTLGVK
jgi:hypothetical protein